MGGTALREIFAFFSIEVEDDDLHKASQHIESFTGKLQAAIPVMGEAFAIHAVTGFISGTIEAGARVYDLANKLGVSNTELQQFQFAAKLAGVEGETAAHTLGFFNRAVGDAKLGNKDAAETFQQLGINIRDSAGRIRPMSELLPEVSDALAKMPDQQTRAAYAMKLFSREGMELLPILAQGSGHLKAVQAEFQELGGGMSEDFVKRSKETQDSLDKLGFGLTNVRVRIVNALLPAVDWLISKAKAVVIALIDWIDHTNILRTGLLALSGVLGVRVIGSVVKLMRVLGLLKATAWETIKAFAGFALPLVAIGLLYLAFDDLFTLLDGGDSEIGAILEDFGGVEGKDKYVQDLKDSWQGLLDLLGIGGPTLDDTNNKLTTMQTVVHALAEFIYELVTGLKLVFDSLVGIATVIKDVLVGLYKLGKMDITGDSITDRLKSIGKGAMNAFAGTDTDAAKGGGRVIEDWKDYWNPGNHPATAGAMPGAQYDNGPGQTSVGPIQYGAPTVPGPEYDKGKGSVSVGAIQVNVTAGKNPEETGKRVGQAAGTELEKQNRDASAALRRS